MRGRSTFSTVEIERMKGRVFMHDLPDPLNEKAEAWRNHPMVVAFRMALFIRKVLCGHKVKHVKPDKSVFYSQLLTDPRNPRTAQCRRHQNGTVIAWDTFRSKILSTIFRFWFMGQKIGQGDQAYIPLHKIQMLLGRPWVAFGPHGPPMGINGRPVDHFGTMLGS